MANELLDIERCIWDADYRRIVKRMLNFRQEAALRCANQNFSSLASGQRQVFKSPEAPRAT